MLSHRLSAIAAFALVAAAVPAHANEFVSDSRTDWYRYTGPGGQDVRSQIQSETGGWRLWDEFAGFGSVWVFTYPGYDWFWIWDGQDAVPIANLSGQVGSSRTIDIGQNRGRATVVARSQTLTTPAGTFNDVTQVSFTTSIPDAGVSSIWFARGVGPVKYETQSIAGPRAFQLASASVGGRSYPQATPTTPTTPTNPTTPAASGLRAPTEHAPMESILWGCNDTYLVLDTYEDAFAGMHGSGVSAEVAVDSNQVASQLRYEMTARNVPMDEVSILVAALDSVWMRDYGPIVLKDSGTGERKVADLVYYPGRNDDDRFPRAYASYRGWSRVAVNISYEGGNFATDGRGQGMSSQGVLWFNDDKSQATILREFQKLGCDRVEFFEPLVDEGTTHIDMFARVMTDTDVLVSSYPSSHRQHRVTEDAARKMAALGYRVTRVESAYRYDEYATYANAAFANGVALIPQYGDATRDRAALDAYRALGYRAVGIDSRMIIKYGGATHCLSMQVPR